MNSHSCARCKAQKLKCIKLGVSGCERCARAGVQCVPAGPSRQGKRTRHENDGELQKTLLQSVGETEELRTPSPAKDPKLLIIRLTNEFGPSDSTAYFLDGFFQEVATEMPSKQNLAWLLRHCAELATARNMHSVLHLVMSLAAAFDIPVFDVVGASMRATKFPFRPSSLPPPPGLGCLLDSLPGFIFARGASPRADGSVLLYANHAFCDNLCSLDTLHNTWSANELPMLARFVHKDDLFILPHEIGKFASQGVGTVLDAAMANTAAPGDCVPLIHEATRVIRIAAVSTVPCQVVCSAHLLACSVGGELFLGFQLIPLGPSAMGGMGLSTSSATAIAIATPRDCTATASPQQEAERASLLAVRLEQFASSATGDCYTSSMAAPSTTSGGSSGGGGSGSQTPSGGSGAQTPTPSEEPTYYEAVPTPSLTALAPSADECWRTAAPPYSDEQPLEDEQLFGELDSFLAKLTDEHAKAAGERHAGLTSQSPRQSPHGLRRGAFAQGPFISPPTSPPMSEGTLRSETSSGRRRSRSRKSSSGKDTTSAVMQIAKVYARITLEKSRAAPNTVQRKLQERDQLNTRMQPISLFFVCAAFCAAYVAIISMSE